MRYLRFGLFLWMLCLAACGGSTESIPPPTLAPIDVASPLPTPSLPPPSISTPQTQAAIPTPSYPGTNPRSADGATYTAQQLIPFDAIMPVYHPQFVLANEATLADDALVMAVAWGEESKAYPVVTMRFHEMVNDELAGIPILVTW